MARSLHTSAVDRLHKAFCPATMRSYMSMFKIYIGFSIYMSWDPAQLTVQRLLVFLEFLVDSEFAFSLNSNYRSGIKAMSVIHGLSDWPFSHVQVKYFVRSLQLSNPITVTLKKIIDIPLLRQIVKQCDTTYMGQVFKAVYLTAFFSFLRLSNFVPYASAQFSAKKHLTREDIFFNLGKPSFWLNGQKRCKRLVLPS